jgi:hypothetical protein
LNGKPTVELASSPGGVLPSQSDDDTFKTCICLGRTVVRTPRSICQRIGTTITVSI